MPRPYFKSGGAMPEVPGAALRRGPDDHQDADEREERSRDAEEAHVKGPDPEVEQVAS